MGVVIKQATYSGSRKDDDPHMPTSGKPQPVLDTSDNSGVGPGVNFVQATYSGIPGDPSMAPDVPTGGGIPLGSTDVQNPEAKPGDLNPTDILKGCTSNG
jgi:hypothetical protein